MRGTGCGSGERRPLETTAIRECDGLRRREAFAAHLAPLKRKNWFVYAKPPFSGPEAVLAYLARYTHRVAIANRRLIALDERGVTFRYKDYRSNGQARYRTMTLSADEFIRRFLLHVLPKGFHRIRHYGLLASAGCKANIARAKQLMAVPMPAVNPPAADDTVDPDAMTDHRPPCQLPRCDGRPLVRQHRPRADRAGRGRRRADAAGLPAPSPRSGPPSEGFVEGHYVQRTRFVSITERELRRGHLTEHGIVEISGRDLR